MILGILIKFKSFLNRSISTIDKTIIGITTVGLGSNDNGGVFHTPEISRTGSTLSDADI